MVEVMVPFAKDGPKVQVLAAALDCEDVTLPIRQARDRRDLAARFQEGSRRLLAAALISGMKEADNEHVRKVARKQARIAEAG